MNLGLRLTLVFRGDAVDRLQRPVEGGRTVELALTRDILDKAEHCSEPLSASHYRGGVDELWVLGVFFLPTAIDIALLPVTGVHDICVE